MQNKILELYSETMKKIQLGIGVIFLTILSWTVAQGQCPSSVTSLQNGSFEDLTCGISCSTNGPTPFTLDGGGNPCVPGWFRSHGSPGNPTGGAPGGGTKSAFMWSKSIQGEGIFTKYDFVQGQAYTICLSLKTSYYDGTTYAPSSPASIIQIKATKDVLSSLIPCTQGSGVPFLASSNYQSIPSIPLNFYSNLSWNEESFTFVPTDDFCRLWIYPEGVLLPTSTQGNLYVDKIEIFTGTSLPIPSCYAPCPGYSLTNSVATSGGGTTFSIYQSVSFVLNSSVPSGGSFDNYLVDWGDGSAPQSGTGQPPSSSTHPYSTAGSYTVTFSVVAANGCMTESTLNLTIEGFDCCETDFSVSGVSPTNTVDQIGSFYLNGSNGQYRFQENGCQPTTLFDCIAGPSSVQSIPYVVSASAATFKDEWDYDDSWYYKSSTAFLPIAANRFETGKANQWRPYQQYVYREAVDEHLFDPTPAANEYKNYDRGTFEMNVFNWKNPNQNDPDKWVLTNQTNRYTPNGEPEEDENVLGVNSTAIYGYNHTLPIAVAQNAAYNTVGYESFENKYTEGTTEYFEKRVRYSAGSSTLQTDIVHTGKYALNINESSAGDAVEFGKVNIHENLLGQIIDNVLFVRVWVHIDRTKEDLEPGELKLYYRNFIPNVFTAWNTAYSKNLTPVSQAGEWTLYEGIINGIELTTAGIGLTSTQQIALGIGLHDLDDKYENGDITIDDVRIQPHYSEMVTYVYDNAQRLTAVFDDQHYAMIYQYNAEGLLVRKLKETEKGIKTISESNYNSVGDYNW